MSSLLFKRVDSSDYIKAKRQMAIYHEYAKTSTPPALTSTKSDGISYNQNFRFIPGFINDTSNCLMVSASYDLRQAYTTGQQYVNIACTPVIDTSCNECT